MLETQAANHLLSPHRRKTPLTILLLGVALALHVSLVIVMSTLGPLAVLPTMIDSYGVGISFAIDSSWNRYDAVVLSQVLKNHGIAEWIRYSAPFHAKLYSIPFALFDPWHDFSIFTAEPANASLYILILILVYKIGKETCDRRTGLFAAGIVAVWPSFLLHTTQFLREPQIIVSTLLLIFIAVRWLTTTYSTRQSLSAIVLGTVGLTVIWLIRGEIWELVMAILGLGTFLLVVRQVNERRVLGRNVACALVLLFIALIIPRVVPRYMSWQLQERTSLEPKVAQPGNGAFNLTKRITLVRRRYNDLAAGSNVDQNIHLDTSSDIIRYLPRAAIIGFLSPFPNMWFVRGTNVGRSGRLLSGMETALLYVIELLALMAVWLRRRQLSVWLLTSVVTISLSAMGLVIVNISIIYRLRYAFMMLIIILGTDGAFRLISFWRDPKAKRAFA